MADTTILINDPDVVRDIQELAQRTGKPAADAVAEAVRAKLGDDPDPDEIEYRREAVVKALAEWDTLPHDGKPLTDADLYDKDGLPR